MGQTLKRILSLFLLLQLIGSTGCLAREGTETGNPKKPEASNPNSPSAEEEKKYSNGNFGVATEYDSQWSYTEVSAPAASATRGDTASNACSNCASAPPAAAPSSGIDISTSPSTEFTDGKTTVTFYYVQLTSVPTSLQSYLNQVYPSRTFESFSNTNLTGFKYDNPEMGDTGGDRQEYYFLQGKIVLYLVTDLFTANNGTTNFDLLIQSLSFQ